MSTFDLHTNVSLAEKIVDTVREPLLVLDEEFFVLTANESFYKVFQVSSEETLHRRIYDLGNGQWDIPALHHLLERILPENKYFEGFEVQHTFETLGTRTMLLNARRIVHGSEKILLAFDDITARKEAQTARFFLASVIDSSQDSIVTLDLNGIITTWNRRAEEIYGYSAAEVVGKPLDILSIPGEKFPLSTYLQKIRDGARVEPLETQRVTKVGKRLWLSVQFSPIKDEAGDIIGISTISRDVTQRHETRVALTKSEEVLQKAISGKTVGVLFFNLSGGISDANDTFTRMCGYTREELRSSVHWKMLTSEDFFGPTFRTAENLANQGEAPPYEKKMIHKDGSTWWGLFAPRVLNHRGWESDCMEFIIDITERKRAEEQLRSQRQLLETVVNFLPAGVALLRGSDLTFEMINPRYQAIGPSRQMVGKTISEVWPEAMPNLDEQCRRVVATGVPFNTVDERHDLRRDDGAVEPGYYSYSIHRVDLPGANKPGILITIWDTTGRKQTEQALRETEERFRTLAENIPQLAWMTDEKGGIFWYNKRWFDFTGTTLEEMKGWGWKKVHHPGFIERVTAKWKLALENGQPWEDEFPVRRHDGQFRWFLSRAFPIRDEHGNIVHWFGTNTDVTELREAQSALAEREAVLRAVTNEAHVGLVMISEERKYLFVNQTYADILGLPDANIVGKSVSEVLSTVYNDQIKPQLDRAMSGERVSYELRLPNRRKSSEGIYEVIYEPRVDDRGRYVVVVIVEITERKKAQEILEETVAERTAALREINSQMEAFTYTIAHDLRAPLRAQQGFANALLQEYGAAIGETGRDYAERIIASAARLNDLVNDLLAFSRIDRAEMTLGKVDVRKVITDVCDEMAFHIHEAKAKIHLGELQFKVRGNELTFRTAVTNLIGNALKFWKPGVPPEVRIWGEERGKCVRLWVEDNGIGIAPEHYQQIFGVFHRLHKIGDYPGTGVGLAIVQKSVERMGGSVGVESEEGRGSRFWIQLENSEKS